MPATRKRLIVPVSKKKKHDLSKIHPIDFAFQRTTPLINLLPPEKRRSSVVKSAVGIQIVFQDLNGKFHSGIQIQIEYELNLVN